LAEQQAELAAQEPPRRGRSFRSYARGFLPHYQARLRPGTFKTVRFHIQAAMDFFGARPIASIRRRDARAFLMETARKRRLGASTVHRYASSLSAVFSAALDDEVITSNPFAGLRLPKSDAPSREYLSWNQVRMIVAHTPAELRPFVALVAETGLRRGEAAALTWDDVGPDRILVRSHVAKSHRERLVPLTSAAQRVLTAVRRDRVLRMGRADRLFPHPPDYYGRRFSDAMKARGYAGITLHALRHACASRIVNGGVPIHVAQTWLGHASVETTRIYLHHRTDALLEAAHALDGLEAEQKRGGSGTG